MSSTDRKAVLLEQWGAANFDPPPSLWTLRQMARTGKIQPAPEKRGRAYYVQADAVLTNSDVPEAPPKPRRTPRTALYRYFDRKGRLLYVGISMSAIVRQAQHCATAAWTRKVARMDVEWLPNRAAAAEAEVAAIRSEKPLHNLMHAEPEC